jgi:hypothetical protein
MRRARRLRGFVRKHQTLHCERGEMSKRGWRCVAVLCRPTVSPQPIQCRRRCRPISARLEYR